MKNFLKRFLNNVKGEIGINEVVMLIIGFVVVAVIAPIALDQIAKTTTTNWETAVITIFQVLLPILFVIGVAIKYVPRGKGAWTEMPYTRLLRDRRGALTISAIVMMVIALLLVAILFPVAMAYIKTNTTAWGSALWVIWTVLLPILVIIGIAVRYVPRGKG